LETLPTLFVFVIDQGSVTNGVGLEYKNGEVTFDLVEFINKITPEMSGPGDQYSLFEFGYYDYGVSRLSGFESRLPSSPPRLETPVPFVTYTPLPTPDVSKLLDLDKLRARNEYDYNLSIQQQENESKAFEEQCNKIVAGTQIAATNTVWEVTKAAEITQIAKQLEEDIGLNEPEERPAPIPWQEVYYGLMHAATDLDYLCTQPASKKYEKCFLIIFDELIDWRNPSELTKIPADITFRLDNVDVIAVITDCAPIQDPACRSRENRWDGKFTLLGAKSTFYLDGIRLEEKLISRVTDLRNKK